jgi:hypothetical protein
MEKCDLLAMFWKKSLVKNFTIWEINRGSSFPGAVDSPEIKFLAFEFLFGG